MTINEQAIKAAVEALKSTEDFTEEVASTLLDSWAETISRIVLEAATPHIRDQLATEIEERVRTPTELPEHIQHKALAVAISTAVDQGMKLAARIIRRKDIQ